MPRRFCKPHSPHHSGQVLSALGQKLHPACFLCFHCGKGLKSRLVISIPCTLGLGQSFLEAEGKPFCMDCYSKEKAEECNSCHMPIVPIAQEEQQVTFLNFQRLKTFPQICLWMSLMALRLFYEFACRHSVYKAPPKKSFTPTNEDTTKWMFDFVLVTIRIFAKT